MMDIGLADFHPTDNFRAVKSLADKYSTGHLYCEQLFETNICHVAIRLTGKLSTGHYSIGQKSGGHLSH